MWAGGESDTQGGVVPPLLTDQQRRSAQGEGIAYTGSRIKIVLCIACFGSFVCLLLDESYHYVKKHSHAHLVMVNSAYVSSLLWPLFLT